MFVMKEEQKHEPKHELRGGKGTLDFCHVVPPQELCGAGTQYGVMTIPPGCSIGLHGHTDNFEIYHVLEGTALVQDGDEKRTLRAGDAEVCSNGNIHSIENIGAEDLKVMAVILWNQDRKALIAEG